MSLLDVKDVWKVFGEGTVRELAVLKNVSFSLERGELVGIVGPSGAGKSTLLQITGMLDRPTKGSLLFEGKDPFGMSGEKIAAFRNRKVGFVFQFHHLLPEFTAAENVMMPLMISGVSKREANRSAEEMLDHLGLKDRVSHRPGELSGGEQQRVALARASVQKPDLILADEPTGNLDRNTGAKVFDMLLELNRENQTTLLVVTHSLTLAAKMPRVLHMADGEIIKDGEA